MNKQGDVSPLLQVLTLFASAMIVSGAIMGLASGLAQIEVSRAPAGDVMELFKKYPKSIFPVISFWAMSLILLAVSGLVRSNFLLDRVALPALDLSEHTLSLCGGVFVSWYFMEQFSNFTLFTGLTLKVAFVAFLVYCLALLSNLARVFIGTTYKAFQDKYGDLAVPFSVVLLLLTLAFYFFGFAGKYPIKAGGGI